MKVPDNVKIQFADIVRGDVEFSSEQIDDQVILKSDGYPTYHLANVVDDHHMKISHVIRGEEWLSSTPKHVLLYDYFGWELPMFAHLPLLLNPDRSKLSKRQGDVAVEDYQRNGYLPEALINFIALLGWNPGDDREIFKLDELEKEFSIEKVNKSGAIFNVEKLNWLNFQHLRRKPDTEVLLMLKDYIRTSSIERQDFSDQYLLEVIGAMRERVTFVRDFIEKSFYFFQPPKQYDSAVTKKRWNEHSPEYLKALVDEIARLENPQKADYEAVLHHTAESLNIGNGDLIHPLRLAVSGVGEGPGVYEIVAILGKEETIKRVNLAIERLK